MLPNDSCLGGGSTTNQNSSAPFAVFIEQAPFFGLLFELFFSMYIRRYIYLQIFETYLKWTETRDWNPITVVGHGPFFSVKPPRFGFPRIPVKQSRNLNCSTGSLADLDRKHVYWILLISLTYEYLQEWDQKLQFWYIWVRTGMISK